MKFKKIKKGAINEDEVKIITLIKVGRKIFDLWSEHVPIKIGEEKFKDKYFYLMPRDLGIEKNLFYVMKIMLDNKLKPTQIVYEH